MNKAHHDPYLRNTKDIIPRLGCTIVDEIGLSGGPSLSRARETGGKSSYGTFHYTAQINSTCSAQLNATLDSQQRELMGEMPNHHSGYLTRAGHSAC